MVARQTVSSCRVSSHAATPRNAVAIGSSGERADMPSARMPSSNVPDLSRITQPRSTSTPQMRCSVLFAIASSRERSASETGPAGGEQLENRQRGLYAGRSRATLLYLVNVSDVLDAVDCSTAGTSVPSMAVMLDTAWVAWDKPGSGLSEGCPLACGSAGEGGDTEEGRA